MDAQLMEMPKAETLPGPQARETETAADLILARLIGNLSPEELTDLRNYNGPIEFGPRRGGAPSGPDIYEDETA